MIELTKDTFNEHIQSVPVTLIDFWAEWCGPCKAMTPILEEFASEQDEIIVAKVNVDEYPELAKEYGVQSIPTMIVFVDGEPDGSLVGAQSLDKLRESLKSYLSP